MQNLCTISVVVGISRSVANTPEKGNLPCALSIVTITISLFTSKPSNLSDAKNQGLSIYDVRKVQLLSVSAWNLMFPNFNLQVEQKGWNNLHIGSLYFINMCPGDLSEVIVRQSECHAKGETHVTTVHEVLPSLQPFSGDRQFQPPWLLSFFVY